MLGALILFFIVMVAYLLIAEIFTVLFRLTGLPEEKARLQVVSLLTTCGFTTKETESFVSTSSRRKLAITAMLFGYAFSATLVSAFISIVLNIGKSQEENLWLVFLILFGIFVFLVLLSKIKFIKNAFDSIIFKLGHKFQKTKTKNFVKVIDDCGPNSIVELTLVKLPRNFVDRTLEEIEIKQRYGLNILAIERSGKVISEVVRSEILKENDIVTMYGNLNTINNIFIHEIEEKEKNREKEY